MNNPMRDEASLSGELAALRAALREVRAPDDEPALLRAARARAAARGVAREPRAVRQTILAAARARRPLGLAAAAGVAAIAVLAALRIERADRVTLSSRATTSVMALPAAAAAHNVRPVFRPIAFPSRFSPGESYSVVRVRLELATFAPGAGAPDASIEADLLVGEDGLARAIRFDSADILPVYSASKSASGER